MKNLQERFWSKVNKEGPFPDPEKYPELKERCWVWTGAQNHGYGSTGIGKGSETTSAHRFSWESYNGRIPDDGPGYHGWCVCHKCDFRLCVNPVHLKLGTQSENLKDRDNKKRGIIPRLSFEQKCLIKQDTRKTKLLSTLYGVSQSYICNIKAGRS